MAHPLGESRPVAPWKPPAAAVETWSRREFANGARSGFKDAAEALLLVRVMGSVRRRRR